MEAALETYIMYILLCTTSYEVVEISIIQVDIFYVCIKNILLRK